MEFELSKTVLYCWLGDKEGPASTISKSTLNCWKSGRCKSKDQVKVSVKQWWDADYDSAIHWEEVCSSAMVCCHIASI